jgi:diguanylate cyclase (GGDEF)-like protein
MTSAARAGLRRILDLYRLRTDDPDLLRAQFNAFLRQIPLLYFVLACNAAAVAISFQRFGHPLITDLFPAILCGFSVVRGVWWWRRRFSHFTDEQIRHYIITVSRLAVMMALMFMIWGLALYPYGDAYARGHLTFFLALTEIGCICCLMPLPSAALGIATVTILPFFGYFLFADAGHMRVEAINFGLVGTAMMVLLYRQHGSFAALIQSQRDLHLRQIETQKLSDENRRIAFTDALSGLPNRRALLARIDEIHSNSLPAPDSLAVIFVDLDGFKVINDIHGHEFGDALIRKVGSRLAGACPSGAMLVRMGGDEFAVLVEQTGATALAAEIASQILTVLNATIRIGRRECQIGASIGVASDPDGATSSYELLRRADAAMYRVKGAGKGGIQHYDPSFDVERDHRARIEQDMREGLARGEFDVAYQPLVAAEDGRMLGVEALVRWPRRPAGPLVPDQFIEIAETSGLIHELGLFVLRRACSDWLAHGDFDLSVNISPAQFRQSGFESEVAEVLRQTGFPPDRLQFEITEGYLIDHPERARTAIDSFRAMGVQVALDDFGTGFASLGYLQNYGFTCVKIDRSLVADLGKHPRAALLISGMVFMGKGLDLKVVAEGVETEQQAAMLRLAGCHRLQGYHFGAPMPMERLLAGMATKATAY